MKASKGLYISANRPRRSTDNVRRSTFACSFASPLRIVNKAGFPGCKSLAFFTLILRFCVCSAPTSGVGMVPGIDASFFKGVGASKIVVLTIKLITSGTNRFESCSYYKWMSYHHEGKGLDPPHRIKYIKIVHWRYLPMNVFAGAQDRRPSSTAQGQPLRVSYRWLTKSHRVHGEE